MGKIAEESSEGGRPSDVYYGFFSDITSQYQARSVFNVDLMKRVCHLTNKIYRETNGNRREWTER